MQFTSNRKRGRDPRLIEGVIANLPLMEGVSRHAITALSAQASLIHAARGDVVIRRGQSVAGVFGIAYGSVKTRLFHPNGYELVLALLGPGATLGEAPAVLARPANLDAIALADSMLVVMNSACIAAQADRDPRLARNLASALAHSMQTLLLEYEQSLLPSLQRLAAYLDSIAQPAETPDTWTARLPVSKTLVAARLGVKKETLSRLLRQLMARGLVEVVQREVRILDRAGLQSINMARQLAAS